MFGAGVAACSGGWEAFGGFGAAHARLGASPRPAAVQRMCAGCGCGCGYADVSAI